MRPHSRTTLAAALVAAAALPPRPVVAQATTGAPAARPSYEVGGELENYLRSLQALGDVPVLPWSLRGFSPVQLDRLLSTDSLHPWSARFDLAPRPRRRAEGWASPIRLRVGYNSTFPYGSNDGAVWAGRGLTTAVQAGAGLRWGPLTVIAAPIVFWTENRSFPLLANAREGRTSYGDGLYPGLIDRPQRFGDASYARVDAGDSEIRLDVAGVSAGFSNAHEWWGPAQRFPFLLGNNAAGFPHVFVGTSVPANLWLARVSTRILWGRLEQSEYFEPTGITRPGRFATGLIVTAQPRGLENLEIGAARFIHAPWPDEGLPNRYLTRAFEGIFKRTLPRVDNPIPVDERSQDGENQLASAFARLVVPGAGFEMYGEFAREDHPWDLRYLLLNPDEQSSLTVGFRKSWGRADRMVVLRGESINFEEGSVSRVRGANVFYVHSAGSNQGHTQRGQLLGADVGVGSAAGAVLGMDWLDARGRWSAEWSRIVRQERPGERPEEERAARALDVLHALSVERLLFGGRFDVSAGITGAYNFNRQFADDRANVSVALSVAGLPW